MALLEAIQGPRDLDKLSSEQLIELAAEIRAYLIPTVAKTSGHIGPNLGVVELTIALHRAFDSPKDTILWDVGHQSYVHKLLTGRRDFSALRHAGGMSGYPARAESEHDVIENSHASTALAYADGIAKAHQVRGVTDRQVVAVIGDGALTGGMAWEALNNIAAAKDRPVIIVVNDNERSYSPTIGGLADHLATLRTTQGYERFLEWGRGMLGRTPVIGTPLYEALHGVKKGLKDIVAPQGLFEDLGLKYVGPVDGHDIAGMEAALRRARHYHGPVIVHAITRKGEGYPAARNNVNDQLHQVAVDSDPETGQPLVPAGKSWTSVFSDEMVRIGAERDDVVGITAAMLHPVGLAKFAEAHPDRIFDVGIAEQHAVTSAAGMAFAGLHPVVAIYATFLNRAFDQVLMDCALHNAGVTFIADRAGVTGNDGASHNGVWDMSIFQVVPRLRIAAPRDGAQLRAQLREALDVDDAPTMIRFSKGAVCTDIPAVAKAGSMDVLRTTAGTELAPDVLLVSVGAMAGVALDVAERLADQGIGATVVDPRWVKPVDPAMLMLAAEHRLVVTVEDNVRVGGVGCVVAQILRDAGVHTPLRDFGVPAEFLDHANRGEVLEQIGLTGQRIAHEVVGLVAGLSNGLGSGPGANRADAAAANGAATNGTAEALANGSAPKVTTL
ncbi:1-deoxy-D-xylulose-5-phosphate synthase [Catenulispora sp. NL8]|uniref:1-deoxy-D-xylulose-5-phosphate synthase n=1 Tax=Catenulispora pinistramenti TaxID=2705254 RepID=A0ABS5KWN2_9ACTN|nr:1-deoxy-D-xylulose-5-phosphate synthase [Catenulispora pinistramenti]MBS2550434.1 1-deoxy-D-xylulose-5-phosphate synthase [Catenulispora pinistramenti]